MRKRYNYFINDKEVSRKKWLAELKTHSADEKEFNQHVRTVNKGSQVKFLSDGKTFHRECESVIKRYNDIMFSCCYEHSTIGTRYAENTEGWNLRDMVAEADYLLSCYYEEGHCRCDDRHLGKEEYKIWVDETRMLKSFIKAYEPYVEDMICKENHCSRFDNCPD